jgi:hypothetical protein
VIKQRFADLFLYSIGFPSNLTDGDKVLLGTVSAGLLLTMLMMTQKEDSKEDS